MCLGRAWALEAVPTWLQGPADPQPLVSSDSTASLHLVPLGSSPAGAGQPEAPSVY